MGMTAEEEHKFVAALQRRGWTTEGDTVWAPSRGLWFSDSHFRDWTLEEFRDIFANRGSRIERAGSENWRESAGENRDASEAAREILGKPSTEPLPGGDA